MIVFDLDNTLSNCSHRLHFVTNGNHDWKSFYEACDKDTPIKETIQIFNQLYLLDEDLHIWTGRCESVRDKTLAWLRDYLFYNPQMPSDYNLQMRPVGDYTPGYELKERWLKGLYEDDKFGPIHPVVMAFDDDEKVCQMWRSHGVFTFNVNQGNS